MRKESVKPTNEGLKKKFADYTIAESISEYIWNSIDAKASKIEINYTYNELATINKLEIVDNGIGINVTTNKNFQPILSSEKKNNSTEDKLSLIHGKNAIGRMAFFIFSGSAIWTSIYQLNGKLYKNSICLNTRDLSEYEIEEISVTDNDNETGTTVSFHDINKNFSDVTFKNVIIPYLIQEFAWVILFNKDFKLVVNGQELVADTMIHNGYCELLELHNFKFYITFIHWERSLNSQKSKYYIRNLTSTNKFGTPTSLNNQGDKFHHSVFIVSNFFDDFKIKKNAENLESTTINSLFDVSKDKLTIYKELIRNISTKLKEFRRPDLATLAKKKIIEMDRHGIFPLPKTRYDQFRLEDLKSTIYEIYISEPKIFNNLNKLQERIIVSLFDRILSSSDNSSLFTVLSETLNLNENELQMFSEQLNSIKLSNIINTIEIIKHRTESINDLEDLIYNHKKYNTYEVEHIQRIMDKSYWILGEQYHLVASTERKFTDVLTRIIFETTGAIEYKKIEHKDKQKEMDLVLVKRLINNEKSFECIVVELKRPGIKLNDTHLEQVKKYLNVIKSEPQFNGQSINWKFYLIGDEINYSSNINDTIDGLRNHGESGLIHIADKGKYKIYIKQWCDIINEYQIRYKFMSEKLQLELDDTINFDLNADEIASKIRLSDAPKEILLPQKPSRKSKTQTREPIDAIQ